MLLKKYNEIITDASKTDKEIISIMKELFKLNHGMLISVGVGHSNISHIDSICAKYDLNGFKLTGAGGGGCAILPLDADTENNARLDNVKQVLTRNGYNYFITQIGKSGLDCQFFE